MSLHETLRVCARYASTGEWGWINGPFFEEVAFLPNEEVVEQAIHLFTALAGEQYWRACSAACLFVSFLRTVPEDIQLQTERLINDYYLTRIREARENSTKQLRRYKPEQLQTAPAFSQCDQL